MAFKLPYIYDYIITFCRQQAKATENNENANVRNNGQGEARHKEYEKLKLGGGQSYNSPRD
jgi:hypothetical protein